MATTTIDLDGDPSLPAVGVRIDGPLGEPIVVIPGAILSPEAAVAYAQKIFQAAADACQQARNDVAGHA